MDTLKLGLIALLAIAITACSAEQTTAEPGKTPKPKQATAAPAVLARFTSGALTAAKAAPAATGILSTLLLMKSKLTPAAALAALIALCGTGGWVAGRSSSRAESSDGTLPASLASRIAAGGKAPADPAEKAHRESLRALLKAAQHDLVTANYDPAAKARAAARIAVIAPEDIRAALAFADELIAASGDSSPLAALVLQHWAGFDPRSRGERRRRYASCSCQFRHCGRHARKQ